MAEVTAVTGVYEANGSVVGELKYVFGKLSGRAHCALCDISHGRVREKARFRRCREELGVPMSMVHLDERDPEVRRFTDGRTPCVVGHTSDGLVMLLDAPALSRCGGDVEAFEAALTEAIAPPTTG